MACYTLHSSEPFHLNLFPAKLIVISQCLTFSMGLWLRFCYHHQSHILGRSGHHPIFWKEHVQESPGHLGCTCYWNTGWRQFTSFVTSCKDINPLHPNISINILHTLYILFCTDKENWSNNQSFLGLVQHSHDLCEWFSSIERRNKMHIRSLSGFKLSMTSCLEMLSGVITRISNYEIGQSLLFSEFNW